MLLRHILPFSGIQKLLLSLVCLLTLLPVVHGQSATDSFVLLNLGQLSRAEIGAKLQEVNASNPRMVAFNTYFGSDRGSSDDPLEKAFREIDTLILGYNLKDRRLGSHQKFTISYYLYHNPR